MGDFFRWLVDPENINANIFGMITVLLSGLISWIISALYFWKGNRNALRLNVIFPIKRILKETRSWKHYNALEELSKVYDAKHLTKHEQKILNEFLLAYKVVCTYSYSYVCAEGLISYFKYKLTQNGIDPQPIPVIINDEVVDCESPVDLFYLRDDLVRIIDDRPSEYEEETAVVEDVKSLFKFYCKEYFTDKEIEYFDDLSFNEVLNKARIRNEWNEKLSAYKEAEKELYQLKIFKE